MQACRTPPVIEVFKATYAGVYVDEYQDCTRGQHELVIQLPSLLRCRILGDPLHAIFRKINKGEALPWQTARENFIEVGTLDQPHRWLGRNDDLGHWLPDVKKLLLKGLPVEVAGAPGVELRVGDPTAPYRIATCFDLAKLGGSVVALCAWRGQCHRLSGRLNHAFHAVEDAQCEDSVDWGRQIDGVTAEQRVETLVEFAGKWLTRLPGPLVAGVLQSVQERKACRTKRPMRSRSIRLLPESGMIRT